MKRTRDDAVHGVRRITAGLCAMSVLLCGCQAVHRSPDNRAKALFTAAWAGDVDSAERLIADGVNVDTLSPKSMSTPLHCAASAGHKAFVSLLIDRGANVSAVMEEGLTPLSRAVHNGHTDVAELLIEHGAKLDFMNEKGHSVLHWAFPHPEAVKLLVAKGANVNITNEQGQTPLHAAAAKGLVDIVEILIAAGAEVDANREHGTPLHAAAHAGHLKTVEVLEAKGADVNASTRSGKTPLSLAEARGHRDVATFLRQHGAKD